MDLQGIPKNGWRARMIEAYRILSGGRNRLMSGERFFTLGGPSVHTGVRLPDCELDYFCHQRGLCDYSQYVSVEREVAIHRENAKLRGPTWIHGDFADSFRDWFCNLPNHVHPKIVSADLMCGVDAALPTMRRVFETLLDYNEVGNGVMVVFNVIATNRWRVNQGGTFRPVLPTIKEDFVMKHYTPKYAELADRFQYENKTVGTGCGISVLETLTYWWKG